jgi:hypothetical protein
MVLALALFSLAAVFSLALIPSYLALLFVAAPPSTSDVATSTQSERQSATRTQVIMQQLSPLLLSTTTTATEAVNAAVRDMPAGMSLEHVSYSYDAKSGKAQLIISGTATRDKIAAYKDRLGQNPVFSSVFVPIGALVGTQDGSFSMTLGVSSKSPAFKP